MSNNNILYKTFSLCFSKFKCLPTITFSQQSSSMKADREEQQQEDSSSVLFKNFNSLYDINSDTISTSTTTAVPLDHFFSSSDNDYDYSDKETIPDVTTAFASHRFFFSSPGSSNSIIDPPENLALPPPPPQEAIISGSVAVQTYSPDPYADFRESMQEMIDTRQVKDVITDWEFLHELLMCYLTLNPKHAHKFIIGAFADVVVSLMSPPPADNVT